MSTVSTLSALLRSARSEVICPSSSFTVFVSFHPSSFSPFEEGREKNPSSILQGHDCSFSYYFPQIHSPTVFGTSHLTSSHTHSHSVESRWECVYAFPQAESWRRGGPISETQDQEDADSRYFPRFPWEIRGASLMNRLSYATSGKSCCGDGETWNVVLLFSLTSAILQQEPGASSSAMNDTYLKQCLKQASWTEMINFMPATDSKLCINNVIPPRREILRVQIRMEL